MFDIQEANDISASERSQFSFSRFLASKVSKVIFPPSSLEKKKTSKGCPQAWETAGGTCSLSMDQWAWCAKEKCPLLPLLYIIPSVPRKPQPSAERLPQSAFVSKKRSRHNWDLHFGQVKIQWIPPRTCSWILAKQVKRAHFRTAVAFHLFHVWFAGVYNLLSSMNILCTARASRLFCFSVVLKFLSFWITFDSQKVVNGVQ